MCIRDRYYAVVLKVLRDVINNMLTFANHDLDLALGNSLVQSEGYQVLLDLFHEDYNTLSLIHISQLLLMI